MRTTVVALVLGTLLAAPAWAQTATDPVAAQLREIAAALDAMRAELAASRRDAQELRQQLTTLQAELDALRKSPAADRVSTLAQDQELLTAKVDEHEQTKVESGSKYHARLSGMMVFNVASSFRAVDSLDVPVMAVARVPWNDAGAFVASVRQSFLELSVFGPGIGTAKTSASVSFDLFGGFAAGADGLASAHARLRTATFSLDWTNTSIKGGQEAPFFSPETPTSVASVAYPALASAGNIWSWTPQVFVEHRLKVSDGSALVMQAGFLDPLTGESPESEYLRKPTAGERSRRPAEAGRVAWQQTADRSAALGIGAYHSVQDWGFSRTTDAWALTGDWHVPVGSRLTFSGELYRGRAIAGLGGGASPSVLFTGGTSDPGSALLPLSSEGGWAQVSADATSRLQFTAAYGRDRAFRSGMNLAFVSDPSAVARNASGFANAIYHARSNIVLSLEYRHLWTTRFDGIRHTAGHLSSTIGIVF